MGETGESETPQTKVLASPTVETLSNLYSPTEALPYSPTLILSSLSALNHSEAQSVVKPFDYVPALELYVTSQPGHVSSVMSERLFNGDLPEGKRTKSNILAAEVEWVVQSLTTLKGVIHPPFSEVECKSPDPVLNKSEPLFEKTPKIESQIDLVQEEVEEDEEAPLT
ncbi:hypothetical protein H5410_045468 [Solanum commersonii]|uniref:Uncharacterized protein n=1 Tax=Solanum commersonii TaxID=4109 RepID=A0A9J5XB78_SOLCO|nr:hypothetical protein H5410_045468 [Solanum commersonii]